MKLFCAEVLSELLGTNLVLIYWLCKKRLYPSTRVDHEFMVQGRGGHSPLVMATLGHSKKYVYQLDAAVVKSDQVAKHLKSRLLHTVASV